MEWPAAPANGLADHPDPFGQLPEEHRPKSRPLSVVFRVDAVDTEDARKQLEEVIVTAQAILAGLRPAGRKETQEEYALRRYGVPSPNLYADIAGHPMASIAGEPRTYGGGPVRPLDSEPITQTRSKPGPPPQPWDADPRGMGE